MGRKVLKYPTRIAACRLDAGPSLSWLVEESGWMVGALSRPRPHMPGCCIPGMPAGIAMKSCMVMSNTSTELAGIGPAC